MNEVQTIIAELQEKGWTLAALADELGVTVNAVEKWKASDRYPNNAKAILLLLDHLLTRKRIPKQRRFRGQYKMRNKVILREEQQRLEREISELNLEISKADTETDKDGKLSWICDDRIQILVEEIEKKQVRLKEIERELNN